jgi:UDPglucose--hexose-1-phosphate uridylyltransferase
VADLARHPHRRFNPLRSEWVIVSPQRNDRPWQGQVEPTPSEVAVSYDPECYLCPGNSRANGERNPQYRSTFAFDNDFPALLPATPAFSTADGGLLTSQSESGVCRVLCFSPRHDLTLARMDVAAIRGVVDAWAAEHDALAEVPWIAHVQIFENRGAAMGASNPHPHCQVWATEHIPDEPAREHEAFVRYARTHGSCLLCDYGSLELRLGQRIVCANESFAALVPLWAAWPFETLVVSRRHAATMAEFGDDERGALADMLKQLATRYDNLFESPCAYSMGFHQQPVRGGTAGAAHFHAHFYPPALRSATIRKFMVGFELLGTAQRDFTPEDAAARLRSLPPEHYSVRAAPGAST